MPVRVKGQIVGAAGVAGLSKETDTDIAKNAAATTKGAPTRVMDVHTCGLEKGHELTAEPSIRTKRGARVDHADAQRERGSVGVSSPVPEGANLLARVW
jgi:hypothetical protein